ncbi:MAG: HEAT repeat domain-containing protein [Planctomycetota bacterium]
MPLRHRLVLLVGGGFCLLVLLSGIASAHGGQGGGGGGGGNVPPIDMPPPPIGGPPEDTPPPSTGGPKDVTPKPGGGPRTPAAPIGAGTPAPAAAPAGGVGAATPMGRRTATAVDSFDHWRFWWQANRERFFDPVQLRAPETAGGISLGRGRAEEVIAFAPPKRLLPILEKALTHDDFDTRAAALIAIARVSPDPMWSPRLARSFRDSIMQVRETTGLTLGILGAPNSVPMLIDVIRDSEDGRRLLGRPTGIETRTRAFATIALGMIGEERALPELLRIVREHSEHASDDIPVAAVQALGLMETPRAIPVLMQLAEDRSASQRLRAAAPVALGRISDPNAGLVLLQMLERNDLPQLVLWSALIGTGRHWEGRGDAAVAGRLAFWMRDSNPQTKHFATIALGQIGGTDARRALLLASLEALDSHQPWISLALGWIGRREGADKTMVMRVRQSFQESRSLEWKTGHAIALALLEDTASLDLLKRELQTTRDPDARADLAMAIGLLGTPSSGPVLESLMSSAVAEPRVQWSAGLAYRLTGAQLDEAAIDQIWKSARTGLQKGTTAIALGLARQPVAFDPIAEVIEDPRQPDLARALATVSLGLIAEKSFKSWRSTLVEDSNYRATADFQAELYSLH